MVAVDRLTYVRRWRSYDNSRMDLAVEAEPECAKEGLTASGVVRAIVLGILGMFRRRARYLCVTQSGQQA